MRESGATAKERNVLRTSIALATKRASEPTTHVHLQEFTVPFRYPVYFTTDAFDPANRTFADAVSHAEPARQHRLFVAIDEGVAAGWPELCTAIERYVAVHRDRLSLTAAPQLVPGGEAAKNDPALVHRIHARLQALGIDRHSFVVVVGGGAVQDAVGYAAATAHRGVRVVRMPTTVLAQGDGGVGVKNGVNAFGTKNFVGTFAPPFAVVNDLRFVSRLPRRQCVAGMAEAVKVALIRDASFFEWLVDHGGALADLGLAELGEMIRRSAALHLRQIATAGDPFEHGSARPLDFGHWAAHKIESLSGHRLCHGEAVAIGMRLDARYSVEMGLLDERSFERLEALLDRLGLPRWDDALDLRDTNGAFLVLQGLTEFREHLGGELTITLLRDIGRGVEVHDVDVSVMTRTLRWLRMRGASW